MEISGKYFYIYLSQVLIKGGSMVILRERIIRSILRMLTNTRFAAKLGAVQNDRKGLSQGVQL
jgi:hypothetical protein